jgi:hypothetical protein
MRLTAILFAAAVMAASSCPAMAASWEEHRYEADDLAMLKEWPGEPERESIEYSTPVIGTAPAEQLVYEEDNIIYRMTVVMLPHLVELGASVSGECVAMAEAEGSPLANMTARVEPGARAIYGRLVSVDLNDNGGRAQTACFFTKGKLYKIEAIILPEHGQPNSSQAIRFTNSLSFNIDRAYE